MDDHGRQSRREFLKKSAVAGAVTWAAPAITTLSGGRAWAQQYPTPCECTAHAYGLFLRIPDLNIATTVDCLSQINIVNDPPGPTNVRVTGVLVCGTSTENGTCTAQATVTSLDVRVTVGLVALPRIRADVLTSEVSVTCPGCEFASSGEVVKLRIGQGITLVEVQVTGAPNQQVSALGLSIIINEERCVDGTLERNALHVSSPLLGGVDLIVSHAEVTGQGCTCPAA
ncbi:MAG: choice-of-anchor P family protein [Actinomycetota bacterium]